MPGTGCARLQVNKGVRISGGTPVINSFVSVATVISSPIFPPYLSNLTKGADLPTLFSRTVRGLMNMPKRRKL
jgi:hypothetical protein